MQNYCSDNVIDNSDRFQTPAQWHYNSNIEIGVAQKQLENAKTLALESDRLIKRINESVLKNQSEVDHRTEVTIKDVEYKLYEIEKQKHDVEEEIELLMGYQRRIANVIKTFSGEALDAIAQCLMLR